MCHGLFGSRKIGPDVGLRLWIERIVRKSKSVYLCYPGWFIRKFRTPPLPRNPAAKVLVHVGCGELNDPRFINVDARAMPHVHHILRTLNLEQFASSSVDLIYACHVLEHVSHAKLQSTLSNWFSRLKTGGVLRLSVPDFDRIVEIYEDQGRDIQAIH